MVLVDKKGKMQVVRSVVVCSRPRLPQPALAGVLMMADTPRKGKRKQQIVELSEVPGAALDVVKGPGSPTPGGAAVTLSAMATKPNAEGTVVALCFF